MGLIFYLSHQSDPTGNGGLPINDKIAHALEYFPLPFLFFRALKTIQQSFICNHYIVLGIMCAILYAVSDEWHQSFIALRDSSCFDVVADVCGIFVGVIICKYFNKKE